jgi:hypothetical protein
MMSVLHMIHWQNWVYTRDAGLGNGNFYFGYPWPTMLQRLQVHPNPACGFAPLLKGQDHSIIIGPTYCDLAGRIAENNFLFSRLEEGMNRLYLY